MRENGSINSCRLSEGTYCALRSKIAGQKIKVARTSPMGVLSTPRMVSTTAH